MYLTFSLLAIVLILLFAEKTLLSRSVKNIPVRILVNGTRGKSTVADYIAELLRSNDVKTLSKITGIVPTVYHHDGVPVEIKRRGGARVTEQFKMIRRAAGLNSGAAVLECMSINPELQKIETAVFKPNFYVITNIREDHIEVMGKSPEERIEAICSAIPENSIVVTSEIKYMDQIKKYAEQKNTSLLHTDEIEINSEDVLPESVFSENLKIALLIARELKLDGRHLIKKLSDETRDESALHFKINEHEVSFYNGFAVNDVPSAEALLGKIKLSSHKSDSLIIIFNSRADRPLRSAGFAEWISGLENIANVIITGDHIPFTKRKLLAGGLPADKITVWNNSRARSAKKHLEPVVKENTTIVGLGNIKGAGFAVIKSFK